MKATGILERILARTRERVQEQKRARPLDRAAAAAPTPTGRRPFLAAVSRPDYPNVIAEFKRRSPSRGIIREDVEPARMAQAYEIGGAAALSVLTEEQFFGGSLEDLKECRQATLLPTLRKDFVIDPYQVWESLMTGADAILLIVAALEDGLLRDLYGTAQEAGLECVVEVHDQRDLERALRLQPRIIGVNSRDLTTMTVDLQRAFELVPDIPDHTVAVAESGIHGPAEVRRLREVGYDAFLIGEHLMLGRDPADTLEDLIRESSTLRWAGRASRRLSRVAVKVCGITSVDDGLMVARAGADAVGFVFWPGSPRALDIESARHIARALPPFVLRVGVFVDASPETLRRTAEEVGLDVLQLHGNEAPEALRGLPRRVLKAVRVGEGFRVEDALRYEGIASGILLDTSVPGGLPGGTGLPFDWSHARALREKAAFLAVAGGLTPENVRVALTAIRPDAVDVSSGVESSPGRKDPQKVQAFVEAVRATER
jgi:indole-3-glycerol phosphate synthase/phosphoribosylanthranilate isomerase